MSTMILPICFSILAASSGVARGMTPGSLKLVRNNDAITKTKRMLSITGMAGDMLTARNGQLKDNNTHTSVLMTFSQNYRG